MTEAFENERDVFLLWVEESDAEPSLLAYLQAALHSRGDEFMLPALSPMGHLAATAQQDIGWSNLLSGRIATHWRPLQEAHLLAIESRRSIDR
jgi:hypothetical protein